MTSSLSFTVSGSVCCAETGAPSTWFLDPAAASRFGPDSTVMSLSVPLQVRPTRSRASHARAPLLHVSCKTASGPPARTVAQSEMHGAGCAVQDSGWPGPMGARAVVRPQVGASPPNAGVSSRPSRGLWSKSCWIERPKAAGSNWRKLLDRISASCWTSGSLLPSFGTKSGARWTSAPRKRAGSF